MQGVLIASASDNTIGGAGAGAGNVIAFNGGDGVAVWSGTGNAILSNSIFDNGGLGIELLELVFGVTPNDAGDGDAGANNLQNFPILTSASGGSTIIQGNLNSTASTQFRLEFFSTAACDPSGNGEGASFIGATTVLTDGSGDAIINATFPATVPPGHVVTATATDPSNNTSEFSACTLIVDADGDGVPDGSDNCPAWPNPGQALPPWPVPPDDPDCDGSPSASEDYMVTLPLVHCPATGRSDGIDNDGDTLIDEVGEGANDEAPDAWPSDADDDQDADIGDVIVLFSGKVLNPPSYTERSDFDNNGSINIGDVIIGFSVRAHVFDVCTTAP
jgi:hypothetical protein